MIAVIRISAQQAVHARVGTHCSSNLKFTRNHFFVKRVDDFVSAKVASEETSGHFILQGKARKVWDLYVNLLQGIPEISGDHPQGKLTHSCPDPRHKRLKTFSREVSRVF